MNEKMNINQTNPDYGEPWRERRSSNRDNSIYILNSADEVVCLALPEHVSRITACVNACAGLGNKELVNPLISVGVLRNALQALGREQKAREKPGIEEELMEKPVEPGFCSISIDAKNLSKHKNIDIIYNLVNKMAEAFEHGEDFSNLGVVAYNTIYQIKLNDKENK